METQSLDRFATKIDGQKLRLTQSFNALMAERFDIGERQVEVDKQLERHRGAMQCLTELWQAILEIKQAEQQEKELAKTREQMRKEVQVSA